MIVGIPDGSPSHSLHANVIIDILLDILLLTY